jgi:hypothetical protein
MKIPSLVQDLGEVVSPLKPSAYGGLVVLRHVLISVERLLRDEESRDDDFREAAVELLERANDLIAGDDPPYSFQRMIVLLRHLEKHIEWCRDERKTLEQCPPPPEFYEQVRRFVADLQRVFM